MPDSVGIPFLSAQAVANGQGGGGCQEAAGLVPAEAGNGAPQEAKVSAGAEGRLKDASDDGNESGAEEAEESAVASEVTDSPA